MNQKKSLELHKSFLDTDNPIELFKHWFNEAKKNELVDPNALSLATSDAKGFPSVRVVLLKNYDQNGFVFYTNLNSKKSLSIKENPRAEMCFYWKSLSKQIRINGTISQISDEEADDYYSTRTYGSKIGAWASRQSEVLESRAKLINSMEEYKKKYNDEKKVPRPKNWSGWRLLPKEMEFWMRAEKTQFMKDLNILKIVLENGISFC
ncbi:MAG: pyridoxine/pyridoxamine 5'-phosphate oxidase [Candidatus Pelagibacterales bacterium]|nr:MAG: pyridoxine/pyridoxamine 5'-phosphate oxidase [Pelagibacterales bacterium]